MMSNRLVVKPTTPRGPDVPDVNQQAWVVYDTERKEICDGAYAMREMAEQVAKAENELPPAEL